MHVRKILSGVAVAMLAVQAGAPAALAEDADTWNLVPAAVAQGGGIRGSILLNRIGPTKSDLYIANADGTGETPLLATSQMDYHASYSKDGQWVVLRVPYPMGFYTKWLDGRIDDPNAGWKGRGLWATVSTRAPFHMEGGKGTTSKVMKFQIRPSPLAR